MEYLSRTLKTLQAKPDFNYHPKCEKLNVVHLGFANDLLLLCRGDKWSIQMLYDCFSGFSKVSGLVANVSKSSIYFGGVSLTDTRDNPSPWVCKRRTPFQIFGGPLELKKDIHSTMLTLTRKDDRCIGRRFLYSQKKYSSSLCTACRTYLWNGGTDSSKKALLAWEIICSPKTAVGYNVTDLHIWNRALFASWVVSKIIKAKKYMDGTGLTMDELLTWNSYSIKKVYLQMRGVFQKVDWRKITCNNDGLPKWQFLLNLTACPYSSSVWKKLLQWQGINRAVLEWQDELQWAIANASGHSTAAMVYRMTVAACIYHLWTERNTRFSKLRVDHRIQWSGRSYKKWCKGEA
ncbi:uncharacterized protein LOC132054068 [Lycium ferocissimum]|uniref:uncharacterized protein LOC132054068 n=1 Tax=Lycium ferocissimum TaxID=112874 RepID=UPI002816112E|nr:uncharacterized protein LOC132054068 [Lycium ferocissimum]